MKKLILISILAVFAVITTTAQNNSEKNDTVKVVYTCSMHSEVISDKPGTCPKCGMDLVKKEVVKVEYTCPMHPEVVSDKPGKCPKCGMDMVKKEAGAKKKGKMMMGCGMKM